MLLFYKSEVAGPAANRQCYWQAKRYKTFWDGAVSCSLRCMSFSAVVRGAKGKVAATGWPQTP